MPTTDSSGHPRAVLQALFVTFLWSTSWVLIKLGLVDLPPLTFAGLRYLLAALILAAAVLARREARRELAALDRRSWVALALLGLVMYSLTQGAQFVALSELPAVMVNLALSFTPAFVALLSIWVLSEPPTPLQWLGTLTLIAGATLYTGVTGPEPGQWFGVAVALLGMVANGSATLLGRWVNREARATPLVVTAVSMAAGSVALVSTGIAVEGVPRLSGRTWSIVVWLAVVNTAFAFTLWNRTLRRLTANESSVINNTMLIQVSILAWLFLGERLSARQVAAVLIAAVGALTVQLGRRRTGSGRAAATPASRPASGGGASGTPPGRR